MTEQEQRQIRLTDVDHVRLREMIRSLQPVGNPFASHLVELDREIALAEVVGSRRIGPDVVTMNSHVRLRDFDTGLTDSLSLVYHEHSDMLRSKLSVLAPLGIGLLGQREGDTVRWDVPGGVRRIRIEKVLYQPEAAGHFHL